MTYDPTNLATFFQHYADTEALEKSKGTKIETYLDDLDSIINDILESWALKEVANIQALRDLYEYNTWDNSATQHVVRDNQIRKVISASDGTNTFMALYWFDDGATDTDADGASGNVDTDNIVSPTSGRATGRYKCIAKVYTDGTTAYVHRDGIEALRTILKYLYINLTDGSSDVALKISKRTAGSQIKVLVNEEVAIRNAADSAYEDFAALSGTFAGAVSGTTGTFSGAVSGTTGTFSGAVSGTTGTFSGAVSGTSGTFTNGITVSGAASSITGGNLNMNSNKITNLTNGTTGSQEACTVAQAEALATALAPLWGTGADGSCNLDGTNTFSFLSKSGNDYTATRDIFATDLTIAASCSLKMNGFVLMCTGTLTINGTLKAGDGANGSNGSSAGAGGSGGTLTRGTLPVINGGNGTAGMNNTVPTVPSTGTSANTYISGSTGAAGGTGGNSTGSDAYSGGSGGSATVWSLGDLVTVPSIAKILGLFRAGGSGGGSGGNSTGATGGGGGGAGSNAQTLLVIARLLVFGGSSSITGVGGNGGNGGESNEAGTPGSKQAWGGGGGGGAGSLVILIYTTKTGSLNSSTLTGGTGGTKGSTLSSNGNGANGSNGVIVEIDV